ncbi:MAG: hypothetical protein JWM11_8052 [Planctomycetaceae bacterium]|nr:hypothetical protein [Planctomycetaceae bacterium]
MSGTEHLSRLQYGGPDVSGEIDARNDHTCRKTWGDRFAPQKPLRFHEGWGSSRCPPREEMDVPITRTREEDLAELPLVVGAKSLFQVNIISAKSDDRIVLEQPYLGSLGIAKKGENPERRDELQRDQE